MRPTARCAVGRYSVRLSRPRAAAAPRRASLALGPRTPASRVTRRASQDPGASLDVDDVAETSTAARDEDLECVVGEEHLRLLQREKASLKARLPLPLRRHQVLAALVALRPRLLRLLLLLQVLLEPQGHK